MVKNAEVCEFKLASFPEERCGKGDTIGYQ